MASKGLHGLTSLGRPLDPGYRTNRAVLVLVPFLAVTGGAIGWASGAGVTGALAQAVVWAGVAFGSWALARELAPDDQAAAFVAMAVASALLVTVPDPSLWLLFAALFLARLVSRTVGPPARLHDSLLVATVALAASIVTGAWSPAAAAALAFAADARLEPRGPRLHGPLAVIVSIAALWIAWTSTDTTSAAPTLPDSDPEASVLMRGAATLASGLVLLRILSMPRIHSRTDVGDAPLSVTRVRTSLAAVLLMAAPSLVDLGPTLVDASAVWATLAGVGLGAVLPRRPL